MDVAVDSSLLVGLLNPLDHRRNQATILRDSLLAAGAQLIYFDCVVSESISVVVRRLHEKRRFDSISEMFDQVDWLRRLARPEDISSA